MAARDLGDLSDSEGRSEKPTTRKFDWCTRSSERRVRADRPLVVGRVRAVRRPDLDETRTRPRQHVRDAEAVADLDQLAARDDDFAPFCESREREEDRGRVVVDHQRGLCSRQAPEKTREMILARAARAGLEVVLEIGVAAADLRHASERGVRQRRAAEIRVHEDSGRVQDTPEGRPASALQLVHDSVGRGPAAHARP